jgi:predicted lipid-binding transport protein (Tim44 family)
VEVGLALGLGELANMAAAYERAVAPAHAPLRRRVRREMRPEAPEAPQRPEAATQTPVATDRVWAQRKAARAESARQWRLSHTLP